LKFREIIPVSFVQKSPLPLFFKLIMRHIFLTGHGGPEVLFCLRDRLWPQFFGTKHCRHSSDDSARAWNFAGGVVAPDMRKTELARPQRKAKGDEWPCSAFEISSAGIDSVAATDSACAG